MKTIKDAYEELKGDLGNTYGAENLTLDCVYLFHSTSVDGEYIVDDSKSEDGGVWQYICTVEEFNNYKGDDKPVYTQAQCDAGELPSVGMECLFKHGGYDVAGVVAAITNEYIVLTEHSGKERIRKLSESPIKPLNPPIELIDGKAYQFDVRSTGRIVQAIYHKSSKKLHVGNGQYFDVESADDIKPLTVEGE